MSYQSRPSKSRRLYQYWMATSDLVSDENPLDRHYWAHEPAGLESFAMYVVESQGKVYELFKTAPTEWSLIDAYVGKKPNGGNVHGLFLGPCKGVVTETDVNVYEVYKRDLFKLAGEQNMFPGKPSVLQEMRRMRQLKADVSCNLTMGLGTAACSASIATKQDIVSAARSTAPSIADSDESGKRGRADVLADDPDRVTKRSSTDRLSTDSVN